MQSLGVDELEAWGNILSDIAQHIAHGFKQSHDWDEVETMSRLKTHFNAAIKESLDQEKRDAATPGQPKP